MSAMTVNAFPPLHTLNSARGWFMAAIVLLHLGFFWALTHGLTINIIKLPDPHTVVDLLPDHKRPQPERAEPPQVPLVRQHIWIPEPATPTFDHEPDRSTAPSGERELPPPITEQAASGAGPVILEPEIDAQRGLSEPLYPAAAIRQNQQGTVLLSVQVLPNGRIGEVRLDRSSGSSLLDAAALREAKRWRLKPGTHDGVPVAMWKQIPITFQLKDAR